VSRGAFKERNEDARQRLFTTDAQRLDRRADREYLQVPFNHSWLPTTKRDLAIRFLAVREPLRQPELEWLEEGDGRPVWGFAHTSLSLAQHRPGYLAGDAHMPEYWAHQTHHPPDSREHPTNCQLSLGRSHIINKCLTRIHRLPML
jgi:hypothetical protein